MSSRATRPRSRRGRHPPPGELDPVVESSEETEVASGSMGPAPEAKAEVPGAPAGAPTGSSAPSRVHAEADQDGGEQPLLWTEPASQGPPDGDREVPTNVYEKLQAVLCSLEAAATAWRVQPQQAEGSSAGTGDAEPEAGVGRWQREATALAERNAWLRLALDSRDAELGRMQAETEAAQREVQELQNFLLSLEPPTRSHAPTSCSEPSSPGTEPWGSQDPPFPLAPPLLRRLRSDPSAPLLPTPSSVTESRVLETQLEPLRGSMEKLKAFNRLLSAVLQGCKGRCEALSVQLSQREAEATALRLALQDSEDCESAYASLLALRGTETPDPGELEAAERQAQRLLAQAGETWPDPLPSSPEGSSVDRPSALEVASQLQGCIQSLREHRALLKIPPELGPARTNMPVVPRAEAMVQAILDTQPSPALPPLHKKQIQQDLAATRESLADLTLQLQLLRREKRGLELREAALRAQGPAHALLQAQLCWELSQLQAGSAGRSSRDSSGDGSSGDDDEDQGTPHLPAVPGGRQSLDSSRVCPEQDREALSAELEASLARALDLQEQLEALREELEQVVQKGRVRRMQSAELNRDLCKAHSSLVLAFRGAHRKQEEQRRKLEQQLSMMEARHAEELAGLEAVARALGKPPPPPLPPRPGETFL